MGTSEVSKKLKQIVYETLCQYEEARRNDDALIYIVSVKMGFFSINTIDFLKNKPVSFEAITRLRRKMQSDHPELQPTIHVKKRRRRLEREYREVYSNAS